VSQQIIAAHKHVYSEKPLALTREEGQQILAAAREKGVRVGCAPDTFLGAGGQTCRRLIDSGVIGEPIATVAFMANHGHESWHPNPSFYYQPGGGPMLDMGPYYLTALVNLLGPITSVSAMSKRSFAQRIAQHANVKGQVISVDVDTHIGGTIQFASGVITTLVMSFDVWTHHLPCIEIYGTEGTLVVPDPNQFAGMITVWDTRKREWREEALMSRGDMQRGVGVADMARAIRRGEAHRASGDLAYHVLDAMAAFEDSARQKQHIALTSTIERPQPFLF
jgi:predicted dehydrogenase